MKTFLIITGIISAYFGVALAVYAVATKLDPYNPEEDIIQLGDTNKAIAFLWPISLPIFLFAGICTAICGVFDKLRVDVVNKAQPPKEKEPSQSEEPIDEVCGRVLAEMAKAMGIELVVKEDKVKHIENEFEYTPEEIETAKAIQVLYPTAAILDRESGLVCVRGGHSNTTAFLYLDPSRFPSIEPYTIVPISKILGDD